MPISFVPHSFSVIRKKCKMRVCKVGKKDRVSLTELREKEVLDNAFPPELGGQYLVFRSTRRHNKSQRRSEKFSETLLRVSKRVFHFYVDIFWNFDLRMTDSIITLFAMLDIFGVGHTVRYYPILINAEKLFQRKRRSANTSNEKHQKSRGFEILRGQVHVCVSFQNVFQTIRSLSRPTENF